MSRFFARSDSESETSSSEDEVAKNQDKAAKDVKHFSRMFEDTDSEDEGPRVVKSHKDKRFDELNSVCKTMRNHRKIKDLSRTSSDFDDLLKSYSKTKNIIDKCGMPGFYIKAIADLEDFLNECWEDKEFRNTLNKISAKLLQTLRNKVRKYNRDFEDDVQKYRENPDDDYYEDDGEEEGADEASSDGAEVEDRANVDTTAAFRRSHKKSIDESGSEKDDLESSGSSNESWSESESDSSTSSSDDDYSNYANIADYFKKTDDGEKKVTSKKQKKTEEGKTRRKRTKDVDDGSVADGSRPKLFPKDADIDHTVVLTKLAEITSQRSRKGGDRREQIELLQELRLVSRRASLGAAIDIKILFSIMALLFEYSKSESMKAEQWKACTFVLKEWIKLLVDNPDIIMKENVSDEEENVSDNSRKFIVRGCLLSVVERLDAEYLKILQNTDPHTPDYVDRLKDEFLLLEVIHQTQEYYESLATADRVDLVRIYIRRLQHLYYRYDVECLYGKLIPAHNIPQSTKDFNSFNLMQQVSALAHAIYRVAPLPKDYDFVYFRAVLYHAYFLAHHGFYFEAKDLLQSNKMDERIDVLEPKSQIMYNRACVRLGISAFCHGLYSEAHELLIDIQSSGKVRELLGQAIVQNREIEKTKEQASREKECQVPFHQQINLDILEVVYLVSAMITEVPYMAAHEKDYKKRPISRNFYYHMRQYERHALIGPPESLAEHMIVASKHMKEGDWKTAWGLINSEKVQRRVWQYVFNWSDLEDFLKTRVKKASLKCFMFSTAPTYRSLSITYLMKTFQLSMHQVEATIASLILSDELQCRIDSSNNSIPLNLLQSSGMHQVAFQTADKGIKLLEINEDIVKNRLGMGGHGQNNRSDNAGGDGHGGGRGDRGGSGFRKHDSVKSSRHYSNQRRE